METKIELQKKYSEYVWLEKRQNITNYVIYTENGVIYL
jgi:hypothetical protein